MRPEMKPERGKYLTPEKLKSFLGDLDLELHLGWIEGTVVCRECGQMRASITTGHLKTHGLTWRKYQMKFPGAPMYSNKSAAAVRPAQRKMTSAAVLADGQELRKQPVDESGRYTITETAQVVGLSVGALSYLRRKGLIPLPEKHGRTHTYSGGVVLKIIRIAEKHRAAGNRGRGEHTKRRWRNEAYRRRSSHSMSAAWGEPDSIRRDERSAAATAAFSPEFIAQQGAIGKVPGRLEAVRQGRAEFLTHRDRVEARNMKLSAAGNRPEVRKRRSDSMKRRMAEKKAEFERLQRLAGPRPPDWETWAPEDQLCYILLLEHPNWTNREIGLWFEDRSRLRCPFGSADWEAALTKPGTGANWISKIRRAARKPAPRSTQV